MRRIHVLAGVAALGAAASLVVASPAFAAVSDLVRVTNTSISDSNDKSVSVSCPATSPTLIGTGFEITGAVGEVVVDDLVPSSGSVSVTAREEDVINTNWTVQVYGICADEPAGLVRLTALGANNSNDFHSVSATCSSGEGLIGTGFSLGGANGEAVVDDFRPNGGAATAPTSLTVGAYEAEAFATNWSVTTYGVCADTLPGLDRESTSSASNMTTPKSATATCDAGKVLVGSGFEVNGATGEVIVDDFRPNGNTLVAPTAVTATAYSTDGFAGNWSVTAYAICATE